jgi:hypothetical protein
VFTRWTDVKVFALQPHVRFRLSDETQAVLGVGPAEADVGPVGGTGYGVAMSLSLRARPARFMSFEARVSNTHVFGQQEIRDHLFVGAGLALALKP